MSTIQSLRSGYQNNRFTLQWIAVLRDLIRRLEGTARSTDSVVQAKIDFLQARVRFGQAIYDANRLISNLNQTPNPDRTATLRNVVQFLEERIGGADNAERAAIQSIRARSLQFQRGTPMEIEPAEMDID